MLRAEYKENENEIDFPYQGEVNMLSQFAQMLPDILDAEEVAEEPIRLHGNNFRQFNEKEWEVVRYLLENLGSKDDVVNYNPNEYFLYRGIEDKKRLCQICKWTPRGIFYICDIHPMALKGKESKHE